MLNKINTYFHYFLEYVRHNDYLSIYSSINYLIFNKSHKNDRIIQTSIGKFFCRKNTNDFQFANLRYEWGVKKFILDHINEYTVFIDAGSCIGDFSILLSKYNIRCIAFEPIHYNREILTVNLQLNDLTQKVKVLPMGISDENKFLNLKFDPINTGASGISPIDQGNPTIQCMAEMRTFDSLLPELNLSVEDHILFKLDVEGMETEALKGSSDFIRQFHYITFIIEEKIAGLDKIKSVLNQLGSFNYGALDNYNIFAQKI